MEKSKKNVNNKKLIVLRYILISVIVLIILVICYLIINSNNEDKDKEFKYNEVGTIDEISNYNYYLEEDATEYYKKLYEELKSVVDSNEVDMEKYASIVARCFVSDVFTLDNKLTSNDIGGVQFIHPSYVDDFVKISHSTLYSGVKSNIYGNREQELPVVSNVEVISIDLGEYEYLDQVYNSYTVNVNIQYEKNLGYPDTYKVILIEDDIYLYVVSGE